MDNDDLPRGRVLSRREVIALLGASGALLFVGCAASTDVTGTSTSSDSTGSSSSSCVVKPELTEGPYYVEEELDRSDIRTDPSDGTVQAGALLALSFAVSRIASGACTPLQGAIVDVWHCNALGVYSDVSDNSFGNTLGKKFLRGYQITDANGSAKFTTIYPGWYSGRAVHIHFKVRSAAGASPAYQFTSQLFFDDSLTDTVHAQSPYSSKGQRDTRNSADGIYQQGGSQMLLSVSQTSSGYAAVFSLALEGV